MQATHAEHLDKWKLNQLVPISRLDLEIFSNIFCRVRDSITRPAPAVWAWGRTKDWIGLTHVCRAWRDIAINTPMLWAEIFISVEDHLDWVQELLRRSKQCPLSILVSKPPESAISAVYPILHGLKNDMHRFRELRLLDIPSDDLHNFFSNSHTHRLEYLHVVLYCNSSDTSFDTSSDTPSNISSSDTSLEARFALSDDVLRVDSLRYLGIEHCGLDFHAAFLRSLTHLELRDIDEDCRLPCIEFVAVLAAIPGLERLKLEGFLKEDEIEDLEAYVAMTNKTHLHIKYLDLSCNMLEEMIPFLCTIVLPSSCKLWLRITHAGPEIAPGFQLITSWLSRHFQPVPSFNSFRSYFRSWRIENTSHVTSDLRVTGFYDSELEGSHIGGEIDKALLSASVLLSYDSESESELIGSFWQSFLKSLPLSNIVSLEMEDNSETQLDPACVEVFAPLAALKTIIINSKYYASFFHIASPASSNSMALPFPALSSVTVKERCVEDYLSIASSLDSRLEAGLAPFNLIFYTDNIKPHAVTQLRKSALNVQIHPSSSSTVI